MVRAKSKDPLTGALDSHTSRIDNPPSLSEHRSLNQGLDSMRGSIPRHVPALPDLALPRRGNPFTAVDEQLGGMERGSVQQYQVRTHRAQQEVELLTLTHILMKAHRRNLNNRSKFAAISTNEITKRQAKYIQMDNFALSTPVGGCWYHLQQHLLLRKQRQVSLFKSTQQKPLYPYKVPQTNLKQKT